MVKKYVQVGALMLAVTVLGCFLVKAWFTKTLANLRNPRPVEFHSQVKPVDLEKAAGVSSK